jgi:hypothetical protein
MHTPSGTNCDDLICRVVNLTREARLNYLVALYVWGSVVTGDTDPWSDLDVCPIVEGGPGHDPAGIRGWAMDVEETFECRVDPTFMPLSGLGCDADWEHASYQWGLLHRSRLILGRDIRNQVCEPTLIKRQLCSCFLACLCVRRLYGLNRAMPLPEALSTPDPKSAWPTPHHGNFAWQTVTAVLQMARAIVFLRTDSLPATKRGIPECLRACGEADLASFCEQALVIGRTISRHEIMPEIPPSVEPLAAAMPVVFRRLVHTMDAYGLKDPSYEPKSGGYYRPDGAPRA